MADAGIRCVLQRRRVGDAVDESAIRSQFAARANAGAVSRVGAHPDASIVHLLNFQQQNGD